MKWIGLTGGIATGKSTVANILRDLGLPVIDADVLSHQVIQKKSDTKAYDRIVQNFGSGVLGATGEIDRKKLGGVVFSDPEKLKTLENIIHPLVQEAKAKERAKLENQGIELAFYDVPLLFEKNLQSHFDCTVLVYCSSQIQRQRLSERDHLSEVEIAQRLALQIPIEVKKSLADHVLENEKSLIDLKSQVIELLSRLK